MAALLRFIVYFGFASVGVFAGYIAGVIVVALLPATNLIAIVGSFLPEDQQATLLAWVGNTAFLVVFAAAIRAGFAHLRPTAPKTSGTIAGGAAMAVALILLLAPRVVLAPALMLIYVVEPSLAESVAGDSTAFMIFVLAAYIILGGTAGLIGGLVHAGVQQPIVVVESGRPHDTEPAIRGLSDAVSGPDVDERRLPPLAPGLAQVSGLAPTTHPIEASGPHDLRDTTPGHAVALGASDDRERTVQTYTPAERALAAAGYPHVSRFLRRMAEVTYSGSWMWSPDLAASGERYKVAAREALHLTESLQVQEKIPHLVSQAIVEIPSLRALPTHGQAAVLAAALGLAVWPNLDDAEWDALWAPFAEELPFTALWAAQIGEPDEFRSDAARAALERTREYLRTALETHPQ